MEAARSEGSPNSEPRPISAVPAAHKRSLGELSAIVPDFQGSGAAENKRWIVVKYGGTSVSSVASWDQIASRCKAALAEGQRVCLVASALSQTTNTLLRLVDEALNDGALDELEELRQRYISPVSPCISPVSPLYLPTFPLYLPHTSPKLLTPVVLQAPGVGSWAGD